MSKGEAANTDWWQAPGYQALNESLPANLVDDFRSMASGEQAVAYR